MSLLICVSIPFSGAVAIALAHYGQGEGPIVLDDVECTGLEAYITDCHHNGYFSHNCIHAEDAAVQCLGEIHIMSWVNDVIFKWYSNDVITYKMINSFSFSSLSLLSQSPYN